MKKGLLYCGNKKNYFNILEAHLENGKEHIKLIKQLYAEENWKNYTVAVHGTKSSMLNIGAVELSEMAKNLEQAGKEEDITYIHKHHEEMLMEYERVLALISDWFAKNDEKKTIEEVVQKPQIFSDELEKMLLEL